MITDEHVYTALDAFGSAEWSVGSFRAMKAAIEAYEQSKWQPIETAPRDGRMVLIMLPRIMNLVVRASYDTVHKQWLCDYGSEGGITRLYFFHEVDLWTEIPPPPCKKPRQFEDAEHSLGGVDQMDNNTRAGEQQ